MERRHRKRDEGRTKFRRAQPTPLVGHERSPPTELPLIGFLSSQDLVSTSGIAEKSRGGTCAGLIGPILSSLIGTSLSTVRAGRHKGTPLRLGRSIIELSSHAVDG
jgi:hypothetical protein